MSHRHSERVLNVGVVGLDMAGSVMVAAMAQHPLVRLVAAADTRSELRDRFAADFGATGCGSVESLCDDSAVDLVYIATPHQFHAQHAIQAVQAGKHVIVEKPLALTPNTLEYLALCFGIARLGAVEVSINTRTSAPFWPTC